MIAKPLPVIRPGFGRTRVQRHLRDMHNPPLELPVASLGLEGFLPDACGEFVEFLGAWWAPFAYT